MSNKACLGELLIVGYDCHKQPRHKISFINWTHSYLPPLLIHWQLVPKTLVLWRVRLPPNIGEISGMHSVHATFLQVQVNLKKEKKQFQVKHSLFLFFFLNTNISKKAISVPYFIYFTQSACLLEACSFITSRIILQTPLLFPSIIKGPSQNIFC